MPIREIMGLFQIVGNVNGILLGISYLVGYCRRSFYRWRCTIAERAQARDCDIFVLCAQTLYRGLMLAEAVIIGFVGSVVGLALSRIGLSLAKSALQQQPVLN